MEKPAASSEIRKEELVSKTTAFAILMLNFVEKKRGNRISLKYNNKKKMSRREANEGAPLQTLGVQNINNFACHYVVIDFVLVYEENDGEETPREVIRFRRRYMNNLQKSQLEFEEVSSLRNMS